MKNLFLIIILIFTTSAVFASPGCGGTGSSGSSTAGPSTPAPSCVSSPPAGNTCLQATPICDLNGYCGSTASSYTADYWCELGQTFCGSSIENNSFLSFTASAPTISFNIWVTGNSSGIQLMVFSAAGNCSGAVTSHACYYPGNIQSGARTITATGLTPGNTYYIMIDGNGGAVCNYVIGANSGIATPLSVTPTATICAGESVNLTAAGGNNTYNWDAGSGLPASTGATVTVTPPGPGTYTYTVHSTLAGTLCAGSATSATSTVTVNPCGCSITAGNSGAVCSGGTFDLTATAVTGGTGYSWTGPNGFTSSVQNPTGIVAPSTPGSYVYTVTTTLNGITCSSPTTVVVNPNPVINAGPDLIVCEGTAITLTATGGTTYGWDNGVSNGVSFVPPLGTTTYQVNEVNQTGCSGSDQVIVTVNPNPVINAGNDALICEGTSMIFSGSGGLTYTWDNNVVNGVPYTPVVTTTYEVTGTDVNGCFGTDQVLITVTPTPVPAFSPSVTFGCTPLAVTYTNLDQANNTYQWNLGNGATSTNAVSATTIYTAPGCYDVTLTSTTPNGCVGQATMPSVVCIFPNPEAEFAPKPMVLSLLNVNSTMVNTSTGATSYIWNFGDGTTSNLVSPNHSFPADAPGTYQISLIAVSEHGCRDTARVNIEVEDELIYYVPNSFTPDNDEHNPVFKPVFTSGFDPFDYKMVIFNRWGEMVFESNDVQYGWDGTYTGSAGLIQDGTYTWKIEFKTKKTDERKMIIGSVSLIR